MPTTSGILVVPAEKGPDDREPQVQSHAARSKGSRPKPARSSEQHKQIHYNLVPPSIEDWQSQDPQTIAQYYAQTESDFLSIVDSYRLLANEALAHYRDAARSHGRWRFWTIIAIGILALINVLATMQLLKEESALLSAVAAVYAGCLAVAGNVESFLMWPERAVAFRESRELLLSRFREYSSKWVYYVEAYGKTPKACVNAGQLYRELVDSDQDLRQKLKQITEPEVQGREKPSSGGQK
jgi:hypothetical protein